MGLSFSCPQPTDDPAAEAPGKTNTYGRDNGRKAAQKVSLVGFGGLGHLAGKLAQAMGADVTVFTHTKEKLEEPGNLVSAGP